MDIDDVATYRPIVGSALSDDGRWVAAVAPRYDAATGARPLELNLIDLDGDRAPRALVDTAAGEAAYDPAFEPGGRHLAALRGDLDGPAASIWPLDGGPAGPATLPGVPAFPGTLRWRAAGQPTCLGDDPEGCRRVWAWPDAASAPVAVTPAGTPVGDYAWGPAGRRLAWLPILPVDHPDDEARPIQLEGAEGARTLQTPGRPVGELAWSPDGRWLAYTARKRGFRLSSAELWVVDPSRWPGDAAAARCVTRGVEGQITGYDWDRDGALWVAVAQGTFGRLLRFPPGGAPPEPFGPRRTYLSGPHADRREGRLIYLSQDGDRPQQLWLREDSSAPGALLADLNPPRLRERLAPAETVTWTATDGTPLDGLLMRPEGTPDPPLLVWLHGGPAEHISHTFSPYFQVFVAAGYAVFAPNYRGSSGRGDAFLRATIGGLATVDAADVQSGVDRVVQLGAADPGRTGLVGWSYGGTLALHVAIQSGWVGAVVAGAPVVDWVSFFGARRFPALFREYFPRPFWDDRAPFDRASPISAVAALNAPTLAIHGARDARVPASQSRLLYRALKGRDIPADLMIYPHEGHVPVAPAAVADMLERIVGWLDRHLGGGGGS